MKFSSFPLRRKLRDNNTLNNTKNNTGTTFKDENRMRTGAVIEALE